MSAKAICEATGKDILNRHLNDNGAGVATCRFAVVNTQTDWSQLAANNQWLLTTVSLYTKYLKATISSSISCAIFLSFYR